MPAPGGYLPDVKLADPVIGGDDPAADQVGIDGFRLAVARRQIEDIVVSTDDLVDHAKMTAAGAWFTQHDQIVHLITQQRLDGIDQIGHQHPAGSLPGLGNRRAPVLAQQFDIDEILIDVQAAAAAGTGDLPFAGLVDFDDRCPERLTDPYLLFFFKHFGIRDDAPRRMIQP